MVSNPTQEYNDFIRANLPTGITYDSVRARYVTENGKYFPTYLQAKWYLHYIIKFGFSVGFDPASLFANGEAGDPFIPERDFCYTKTSGGVYEPATTTGDVVARLTGMVNGNNADQDVVASRPVYMEGGGLSWLQFDGVDDGMTIIGSSAWYDQRILSIVCGVEVNSTTQQDVVSNRSNEASAGKYALFVRDSGLTLSYGNVGKPGTGITTSKIDTPYIFYGSDDGSDISAAINGGALTTEAITGYNASGSDAWIGQKGNNENYFAGKIYGLILTDDILGPNERSNAEKYIAAKSGVTL